MIASLGKWQAVGFYNLLVFGGFQIIAGILMHNFGILVFVFDRFCLFGYFLKEAISSAIPL